MITDAPIPFAGPKSSMLSRWRVKLCFQGYGGRPVDVYAPLDPFVCTTNPQTGESEGLLCAGAPSKTYILGLVSVVICISAHLNADAHFLV